jgi:hypothetical protein
LSRRVRRFVRVPASVTRSTTSAVPEPAFAMFVVQNVRARRSRHRRRTKKMLASPGRDG